ncbi:hypothetical protein RND81_12G174700 [Saponaria officinalis]|uniref:23 kDa jasmonate-induced protein-like n=1 Tax=Saponaria officinalis TaxID=3572 RepID=A0AAW1HBV3_SAPOF
MASSMQQCKNATQAFETEKAKVNEVMKDAKNSLRKKDVVDAMSDEQIQAMAVCELRSGHGHQSRYYMSHSWTGNFMTRIPDYINAGDSANIVHKGSKGGVIYGLLPENRSTAWLLAWSKSDNPNEPNRVYVRGGTREKLLESGIWNEVERELDQAGDYSRAYDPESGALIAAQIQNDSDKVALVAVTFNILDLPK